MKLLLNLVPKMATVIRDGESKLIAVQDVVLDDIIEVRPGSTIAVDGVVLSGLTYIDESMVTGESVPVVKRLEIKLLLARSTETVAFNFERRQSVRILRWLRSWHSSNLLKHPSLAFRGLPIASLLICSRSVADCIVYCVDLVIRHAQWIDR